jgi:hypothetical protein
MYRRERERDVRLHRFDKVGRAPADFFFSLHPLQDIKLVNESSPISPFFFLFLEPNRHIFN